MLGAIIGDICGSVYERTPAKDKDFPLIEKLSNFTDDTVLTVAIADAILSNKDFGETLRAYALQYPLRGYGFRFNFWTTSKNPEPYNSFGNGSAMRVSSVGWLCNSIEEVLDVAKQSAEVTHNHEEGIKGAQAVALAIFLARNGANKDEIKKELETRFQYNLQDSYEETCRDYSFDITCQGSVPQAIIAFFASSDYEDTIRKAIWLKGDADTQACIAGSIAEAYYKEIPQELRDKAYEVLPKELIFVFEQFKKILAP